MKLFNFPASRKKSAEAEPSALRLFLKQRSNELSSLPRDVGAWPVFPRRFALGLIFLASVVLGGVFDWRGQDSILKTKLDEEQSLRADWLKKRHQALNLGLYHHQLKEVNRAFALLLEQLPSKSEVDGILSDISGLGIKRGLQFEYIRPEPEQVKEFYVELPISMKLSGKYHDFAEFVVDISKLPRIVTLTDIKILPSQDNNKNNELLIEATAVTFRYVEPENPDKKAKIVGPGVAK